MRASFAKGRLYYFGARWYDPELGLWISPDPAHQFASPYAYGTNPTLGVDPNGQWFIVDDIVGGLIGAGVGAYTAYQQGYDLTDWQTYAYIGGGAAIGVATVETGGAAGAWASGWAGGGTAGAIASGAVAGAAGGALGGAANYSLSSGIESGFSNFDASQAWDATWKGGVAGAVGGGVGGSGVLGRGVGNSFGSGFAGGAMSASAYGLSWGINNANYAVTTKYESEIDQIAHDMYPDPSLRQAGTKVATSQEQTMVEDFDGVYAGKPKGALEAAAVYKDRRSFWSGEVTGVKRVWSGYSGEKNITAPSCFGCSSFHSHPTTSFPSSRDYLSSLIEQGYFVMSNYLRGANGNYYQIVPRGFTYVKLLY